MITLRALFLTMLLATSSWTALATDFFVSTARGNDKFDGRTAAPTSGAGGPFRSLKALETITLQHGDRVLLRCGDQFTGPLLLKLNSQMPGELILTGFGDCSEDTRPTIDGRVPMVFAATGRQQQTAEADAIAQVFSGNNVMPMARYPTSAYLILPATVTSSTEVLMPHASLVNRPLVGARLHARTQEWYIEERNIVSSDGKLDSALQYPLRPKTGFYLTGKAWMIGDQDSWSFDTTEKKLTVRATPSAPLSKVLTGHLLQVLGKGSISIVGINFYAAGGDAIYSRLDGTVSIKDVSIHRAFGNGISISGARSAFVLASTIKDVGLDAIFFAETKRAFVRRNVVENAGLYGGPRPSLAAINAHRTDSATIEENIVENSAYHGIRFAGDARVRRNYVAQSCLRLSDCAAIYTWRRNATDRRPHSEIVGNLIVGASGDTTVKLGVNDWFAGIYLDEFSNNILVTNNIIAGVNQGIYLHNAYENQVHNNVVRALKKTLIDAADKSKIPVGTDLQNLITSNSERLGQYATTLVDASGKEKIFSFDTDLVVKLVSQGNLSVQGENRHCSDEKILTLAQPTRDKTVFSNALNCD